MSLEGLINSFIGIFHDKECPYLSFCKVKFYLVTGSGQLSGYARLAWTGSPNKQTKRHSRKYKSSNTINSAIKS